MYTNPYANEQADVIIGEYNTLGFYGICFAIAFWPPKLVTYQCYSEDIMLHWHSKCRLSFRVIPD